MQLFVHAKSGSATVLSFVDEHLGIFVGFLNNPVWVWKVQNLSILPWRIRQWRKDDSSTENSCSKSVK